MSIKLSSKQRRHLKSLGHHLQPVVMVGKGGISSSVLDALAAALLDHELIKAKLGKSTGEDRHQVGEELAQRSGAILAGIVGNTMLLYKEHPETPKIKLPR